MLDMRTQCKPWVKTVLGRGDTERKSAEEQTRPAALEEPEESRVKGVSLCKEEKQVKLHFCATTPGVAQGVTRCHVALSVEWRVKCREEE